MVQHGDLRQSRQGAALLPAPAFPREERKRTRAPFFEDARKAFPTMTALFEHGVRMEDGSLKATPEGRQQE
jgi:hypothetical protein